MEKAKERQMRDTIDAAVCSGWDAIQSVCLEDVYLSALNYLANIKN